MGPRQDEQEQALSEGKKGAGFCTVQVGESASLSSKGACIFDVCSGWGEGGTPNTDVVKEVA